VSDFPYVTKTKTEKFVDAGTSASPTIAGLPMVNTSWQGDGSNQWVGKVPIFVKKTILNCEKGCTTVDCVRWMKALTQGRIQGEIGATAPPKTYENKYIHHDFV